MEKGVLYLAKVVADGAISIAEAALRALQAVANAFFEALSGVVGLAQGVLDIARKALEVAKAVVSTVFSIIEEALRLFKLSYLKFSTEVQPSSGITVELQYDFTILGTQLVGKLRCSLTWKGILEAISDLAVGKLKEYITNLISGKKSRSDLIDFTAIEAPIEDVCALPATAVDSNVLEFVG